MDVKFVKKDAFTVIGYERQYNLDTMKSSDIPGFWDDILKSKSLTLIENPINYNECLGLCIEMDSNNNFNYIIGISVDKVGELPAGAKLYEIKECEYAVFTVLGEVPKAIQDTWMYIMNEWLPISGYKMLKKPNFELYDEKFTGKSDSVMYIYIPVEKK